MIHSKPKSLSQIDGSRRPTSPSTLQHHHPLKSPNQTLSSHLHISWFPNPPAQPTFSAKLTSPLPSNTACHKATRRSSSSAAPSLPPLCILTSPTKAVPRLS